MKFKEIITSAVKNKPLNESTIDKSAVFTARDDIYIQSESGDGFYNQSDGSTLFTLKSLGTPEFKRGKKFKWKDIESEFGDEFEDDFDVELFFKISKK